MDVACLHYRLNPCDILPPSHFKALLFNLGHLEVVPAPIYRFIGWSALRHDLVNLIQCLCLRQQPGLAEGRGGSLSLLKYAFSSNDFL